VNDARDILRDLVAIPTVSTQSNEAVIEYAQRYFSPEAWQVDLYEYKDGAGIRKMNLVAEFRCQGPTVPELAFVCHTDTVPFDPSWAEALRPVEQEGNLYGRGSCDVKGFLACILQSIEGLSAGALRTPLAVVLTADEEIGRVGMKHLATAGAVRARRAIVGEPTGLRPVRGGKGYGLGEIVVRGKEAHSAYPARGRSAILDAARVVLALEDVSAGLMSQPSPGFDPPYTTLNAGLIQGGTAKNIVPGECRIVVEWRPVPGEAADLVPTRIARELSRLQEAFPGFNAEFHVSRFDQPFAPSASEQLASFLTELTGHAPGMVSFGSEAAHIPAEEVVVFGPGDMTTAHRTGEFVPLEELALCVRCLTACIHRFCGRV